MLYRLSLYKFEHFYVKYFVVHCYSSNDNVFCIFIPGLKVWICNSRGKLKRVYKLSKWFIFVWMLDKWVSYLEKDYVNLLIFTSWDVKTILYWIANFVLKAAYYYWNFSDVFQKYHMKKHVFEMASTCTNESECNFLVPDL